MRQTGTLPSIAHLRSHLLAAPASVQSAVRSQERSPKEMLTELSASHDAFKAKHQGFMDNVQSALDDINARMATQQLNGYVGNSSEIPPDPGYTSNFMAYARGGQGFADLVASNREGDRGRLNAAMSVSPGEAGGVLAPTEWDRRIQKSQRDQSSLRQIADVQTTSVNAFSTVWNMGAFGSGWVGEVASRPATSTPDLRRLEFNSGEIYANPFVTQKLLDDADFNVEKWLSDEIADEFDRQEGIAFIAGDGVNKPNGFLTYVPGGASEAKHPGGTLAIVATGKADTLGGPDTLVDFVYSHPATYRRGAHWLMNSTTAAYVAKLKDGQGAYLWRETYVAGQPATLLGYPVSIDENMPNVAAGAFPIAFGDFKAGYVINDRIGVRILRDPYTNKPYVGFYVTKRVGGGVLDPKAIRLMKVGVN